MPSLRDELAQDMQAAIASYGQTFEWNGVTYPCVRRDTPTMLEVQQAGGEIEAFNLWIIVAKADLADQSVDDQAARYALTGLSVGDVVRQADTGDLWTVLDAAELDNSAGWEAYTFPAVGDGVNAVGGVPAHQIKSVDGAKDNAAAQVILGCGSFDS